MPVTLKYVIGRRRTEDGNDIEYHAAVFSPNWQYHKDEFEKLQEKVGPLKFFGAAYCDLDFDKVEVIKVYRDSVGFGSKANDLDFEVLTKLFKEDKIHEQ